MAWMESDGAVAQLARAPALQAGCRGFEPLQLHKSQVPGGGLRLDQDQPRR